MCTEKGQRVYRKLRFSDVGRVSALSADITVARNIPVGCGDNDKDNMCIRTFWSMDGKHPRIDSATQSLILAMDAKATGFDRTARLSFMMDNDCSGSTGAVRTIAATASVINKDEDEEVGVVAAAIIRQEQAGGPFVIGPMMGSPAAALPLVRALAGAVASTSADDHDGAKVSMMVSNHLEMVDSLKTAGFEQGFEFPAMALDGKPIYAQGDGSYLSLIHPTLG